MSSLDSVAHVTIPVGDLAEAEAFYIGLLGAKLLRRFDREAFLAGRPERAAEVDNENSPLHIALRFGDSPEFHLFLRRGLPRRTPPAHPHVALQVDADELDSFRARLMAAGVPLDGPRRLGPPGHASVYFADPWGQLLELVTLGYHGEVMSGPPNASKLGYAGPLVYPHRP
jgi:catechol 2,3-dioxygenase-like lactoylglutathione lyase family enzyme